MENPCKILCFGDSLTRGYVPAFERRFRQSHPEIQAIIVNAGAGGETSREGLRRLPHLIEERPHVVLIGFGMNDQAKGVTTVEMANNLSNMIAAFEEIGARVLLLTINPVLGAPGDCGNARIDAYNQVIRDVAWEKRVRIVDVGSMWKREISPWAKGLRDSCHPNDLGNEVYCKALLQVVPRSRTILLWQYNGNPCACNYACPYCPYDPQTQAGHNFKGTIEGWHQSFKKSFGNQRLVFYFGHGEPMVGKRWFDVVEMIGSEPDWKMRLISNISPSLTRLLSSRVAREGRLNINASFHPTETTREKFLQKLIECREHGIEVPVVYTMWPPFFERFEEDFAYFDQHNFLVHVRRFRGRYQGKWYPEAYSEDERRFIARYADDATIKYMLSDEPTEGKLTWSGVDFAIVDNEGNVGYCNDFRTDEYRFGNVHDGSMRLRPEPMPFPGRMVSDGTVDGVANLVELGYTQLDGNNILQFARQGGVYHVNGGVFYKNMNTDFDDRAIRAAYRFPPRNIRDCYHIWRCEERDPYLRRKEVIAFLVPDPMLALGRKARHSIGRLPGAKRLHGLLRNKSRGISVMSGLQPAATERTP